MGGTLQGFREVSGNELRSKLRTQVTALRADFVARPEAIEVVRGEIEERVLKTWGDEPSFLSGVVMVSEQEARLTTLITFWRSGELERTREQRVRWLQKIIGPYLDRCVRVQTQSAYFLAGAEGGPEEAETLHAFSTVEAMPAFS